MATPGPDSSRLARAIQIGLQFRDSGRTDVDAFLDEHPDLRDLLEPIVLGSGLDEAGESDPAAGTGQHPAAPAPGRRFGNYELLSELGRGGMGAVFLAHDRGLDRHLAVKVLTSPSLLVGERSLLRFQREAKLLASLDHPGVVRVLDVGVHDGIPFFAMELVRGASLAELLTAVRRAGATTAGGAMLRGALRGAVAERATSGWRRPAEGAVAWRLPDDYVAAIVTLIADVAEALAYAHAEGVVHRDVKPSNILVREDGRAMLIDFGVARQEGAATLTATGDLAGTPNYMAPEQARSGTIDDRTDLWALGVTLYEALTLQLPFGGDTTAGVVHQLLHAEPVDPRRHQPAIRVDLAAVMGRALVKEPAGRYQTAAEFAAELRAVLAGEPVRARLPGPVQRLHRWARREPWRAMAAALAAAAVVLVVVIDQLHAADLRIENRRRSAALAEVNRLAIGVRLDRAIEAARSFRWPGAEAVPAIEVWQREHRDPLAAELPTMLAMLERLRAEALPYGPADALAERQSHPEAATLAKLETELAAIERLTADQRVAAIEARRSRLLHDREGLRSRVEARRSWRFADGDRQFLHDEVARVVARLQEFFAEDGLAARIAHRAASAIESQRRCIEEVAELWQTVAADLAADPRFGGLRLLPQRDLLPLGKDPRSSLWEFVHLASGRPGHERPTRRDDGTHAPSDGGGIVFVLLPGGSFAFGAQATDPNGTNFDPAADPSEGPVQTVRLDPFFLGKFELTRSQWQQLTNGDVVGPPTQVKPPGLAPVEGITQEQAASVLTGVALALPTEAQWEYGCRAGVGRPWHFGDRALAAKHANFAGRSVPAGAPHDADVDDDGHRYVIAPGQFAPNAFGLHDMHGNVAEVTADRVGHLALRKQDGRGSARVPFDEVRVVERGGSNQARLVDCRSSRRGMVRSTSGMPSMGLRVARPVMQ